jgi:succinate dehydrogenase/fumarate reductase-like Fe-S protein
MRREPGRVTRLDDVPLTVGPLTAFPLIRDLVITKCCSEVCPEGIHITENAMISLKERVVDRRYDPLFKLARRIAARRRR